MLQGGEIRLGKVDGGLYAVRHVHHGQRGILFDEACVSPFLHSLVEDVHRVVRGAPARRGFRTDYARVAQPPHISAETLHIVVSQQLSANLGNTVHCPGLQNGFLWRILPGGFGTEHRDAAGNDYGAQLQLHRQIENVQGAVNVDPPAEGRVLLPRGGKNGGQMVDRICFVFFDRFCHRVQVSDIQYVTGAGFRQGALRGSQVGGHHIVATVALPKRQCEFASDLAQGAGHQDSWCGLVHQGSCKEMG